MPRCGQMAQAAGGPGGAAGRGVARFQKMQGNQIVSCDLAESCRSASGPRNRPARAGLLPARARAGVPFSDCGGPGPSRSRTGGPSGLPDGSRAAVPTRPARTEPAPCATGLRPPARLPSRPGWPQAAPPGLAAGDRVRPDRRIEAGPGCGPWRRCGPAAAGAGAEHPGARPAPAAAHGRAAGSVRVLLANATDVRGFGVTGGGKFVQGQPRRLSVTLVTDW